MKPTLTVIGATASLKGTLTISNFDAMLHLMKELQTSDVQTVFVDNAETIDLSAIQLLWSLSASRKTKGQSITIAMALTDSDTTLLRSCGLAGIINPK